MPTDDCLLCLEKKATQKNSHIISAALLKESIGKRYYELSYEINTAQSLIDTYFGRSRLDNPSTEIKQNHYSRDYYFCPECEKRMGFLESEVTKSLANINDPKYSQNYGEFISPGGIRCKTLDRLDSDKFNMFFLLTVWRIALLYSLEKSIHAMKGYDGYEMEVIRKILHSYFYGDTHHYEELKDQFGMLVFCAETDDNPTRNISLTVDFVDRPNLFWAFGYLILVYSSRDLAEAPSNDDTYFVLKPDFQLINTPSMTPKIAMLPEETWDDIIKSIMHDTSTSFVRTIVESMAIETGLPPIFCQAVLYTRAKELEAETGQLFADCCTMAFEEILDKAKG